MGLDAIALKLVAPHLKHARVLCLGYPDLVLPPEQIEGILGVAPRRFTDHGRAHKLNYELAETVDTLELAGARQVSCVDIRPSRGCERVVDLNLPQWWEMAYDLVIDPGTLEHCFNIGQAFSNAWAAVGIKGVIVHVNPMTMMNHGFFNIGPTAFVDFYEANGGQVLALEAADRSLRKVEIERVGRFIAPPEVVIYAAIRKTGLEAPVWPTQSKYK